MTTPELPPLRRYDLCLRGYENTMKRADDGDYCDNDDREARERILLARIAELESLWQSAEARYAEADAAAMAHAKRIAELQEEADRRTREVEATYHVQRTLRERIAEREAADIEAVRFARRAAGLLHGFMLDTNAIGAMEAGVNLARSIKEALKADAAIKAMEGKE